MSLRREDIEVVKLSLSDIKMINYLQRELTLAREMLSALRGIMVNMREERIAAKIKSLEETKEEIFKVHSELLTYLSRISPALYHREDWLRVASKIISIVDKLGGTAYRLEYFARRGWELPGGIREKLTDLARSVDLMLDAFSRMLSLTAAGKPKRAFTLRDEILKAESSSDSLYRSLTFTILESDLSVASMMLLMSTAEMLEDISDTINAAADDLYIILLDMAHTETRV